MNAPSFDLITRREYDASQVDAEAMIGGILRGGKIVRDRFCFHAAGMLYSTPLKVLRGLKILKGSKDAEP